jgi:CheY-like chemotaxis protein
LLNSSSRVSPLILVVEDDPVIADMLRELLAGAGYRVQWAPDVISALSVLERLPINLITLDIELGTYSGRGLLAFLKADPRTSHLPVIVVSSCQVGPDVRRLAEHVLHKPFNIGPLLHLIRTSLGGKPARLDAWPDRAPAESLELEMAPELLD